MLDIENPKVIIIPLFGLPAGEAGRRAPASSLFRPRRFAPSGRRGFIVAAFGGSSFLTLCFAAQRTGTPFLNQIEKSRQIAEKSQP